MRKTSFWLILVCLALICSGCSKSSEAKNVDELISSIGIVDYTSEAKVNEVLAAYNALTEDQKKEVENYALLISAKDKLDTYPVIPDLSEVSEQNANNILSSMGLIPVVEYKNNAVVDNGAVISTEPSPGQRVDKNSRVTVIVSSGPSQITAKSAYMNWMYISGNKDNWEFHKPYIKNDILYIECPSVVFGAPMEWRDRYNKGIAGGTASISDSFSKAVPFEIDYNEQKVKANQAQSFVIKVPLKDLGEEIPTSLYFKAGITVYGREKNLEFNIAMTWQ